MEKKKVTMKQENIVPPISEEPVVDLPSETEGDTLSVPEVEDEDLFLDEETSGIDIADLPPDTVLWDDGPTAGQVLEWKNKHKNVFITNVTYEKHIVWRTLLRSEYKQLVREIESVLADGKMTQSEANMYNEELTCTICCLFPKYNLSDLETEDAGVPSIVSQQIMESSGFATIDVRQL